MKSDPATFGWPELMRSPGGRATWDGVRNYQARNFLRDDVKPGDGVLFYHSGSDKAVMGICEVVRGGFPDPADPAWTAVEIALKSAFKTPVTFSAMRAEPGLRSMVLLQKGSRLSIQPVTQAEWAIVVRMGGRGIDKRG